MRRSHGAHRAAELHPRSLDDYDEYEEDEEDEGEDQEVMEEEEEEEEDEEKEDPKPTEEELEYLKQREQIKDRIRQKFRKENADALGRPEAYAQDRNGVTTKAKFGSFFGPSQPVIASRVIEESRSMRETHHIVTKTPSNYSGNKREPFLTSVETKTRVPNGPPKVVNELRSKVRALKDTRDYSFLLSDDAELPASAKEPASQGVLVPNSDARSAHTLVKTTVSRDKPIRRVPDGRLANSSVSAKQHMQNKEGFSKTDTLSRLKSSSAVPRKKIGSIAGIGPGRPVKPNTPAQSVVTQKPLATVVKKSFSSLDKPPLSKKPHASAQKQYSEQKRVPQGSTSAKVIQKQPMSSSKLQLRKPLKKHPQRNVHEDHPRRRPSHKYSGEENDDGDDEAIKMIREMFRYNPNKYAGVDDDDSDMEANFDSIMKEEQRSSRIAKQEDEEQLRLIEEEERLERLRKKRKISQR